MDWFQVLNQLGFPVAVCAGMAYGMWHMAHWLGTNVVVPLKDAHLRHLAVSEDTQNKLTECMEHLRDDMQLVRSDQREHMQICRGGHPKPPSA